MGTLSVSVEALDTAVWSRLKLAVRSKNFDHAIEGGAIKLPWADTLSVVRELGSKAEQTNLNFRFRPEGEALARLRNFARDLRMVREQRYQVIEATPREEIVAFLRSKGFTRKLRDFQVRDLARLLSLTHGANFSVPGAGKTTVTFALHLMNRHFGHSRHFVVVAPKAAFGAWTKVVGDCLTDDASDADKEPFTRLTGKESETRDSLRSGATRFIISYDMAVRQQGILGSHFATTPTHVVLDESHRMKAGWDSQRGAFLLRISDDLVRRDILTGTPMPQAASDIASQLDFLWPGHGYGLEITYGKSAREVLGNLYVRTTKEELGLPPAARHFIDVPMDPGQLALYSIVRNEFVQSLSRQVSYGFSSSQVRRARQSIMRLLQLSINPVLALNAMTTDNFQVDSGIVDQVLDEGHPAKMRAVMDLSRELASGGKKSVIWTIFTDTIHSFVSAIADLNPVFIHGGIPLGSPDDLDSREGRLRRFHEDDGCSVLVANPAAAGEGIDLHTVCHHAIYADRSYVSTHYLQSIDRVHRLGLPPNEETHIHVFRSTAPPFVGSIDLSVSRRLIEKIRNMQTLLNDPDLHELALDEEEASDPLDYDVDLKDIIDLIAELEGSAPNNRSEQE